MHVSVLVEILILFLERIRQISLFNFPFLLFVFILGLRMNKDDLDKNYKNFKTLQEMYNTTEYDKNKDFIKR